MRYKTITQETLETTKNLFVTYLFTSVFIVMLMRARVGAIIPKNIVEYISSNNEI